MTTRFGPLLQEELVPVLSLFLTAAGENAESGTQAAKVVLPAVWAGVLKSTVGNPDYAAALYRQAGAESGLCWPWPCLWFCRIWSAAAAACPTF